MFKRKDTKRLAKTALKKHYLIYVIVCSISAILGIQYVSSIDIFKMGFNNLRSYSDVVDSGTTTEIPGISDVWSLLARGEFEKSQDASKQLLENKTQPKKYAFMDKTFGRSKGVLSHVVNQLSSGAILITAYSSIQFIVVSRSVTTAVFIALSFFTVLFIWIFILNVYKAAAKRIFLEGRIYSRVPASKFMFFMKVKKWINASLTMLLTTVYKTLWSLTIIGGFIKECSYFCVPYIVAENPGISPNQAITLSRKMMRGHKWEYFVFQLSFTGWKLLGFLTIGLSDLLFANPYMETAFCEYFIYVRSLAKENNIENIDLLNDTFLYEIPDSQLLRETYSDVWHLRSMPTPDLSHRKGILGKILDFFGITLAYGKRDAEYEKSVKCSVKAEHFKNVSEGLSYPSRLSPFHPEESRQRLEYVHYLRHYSVTSLVLMFFIFAFAGWIWEVMLHFITSGKFVNRGVLHGPWLPIYGCGGILILTVLNKCRKKPVMQFVSAVVLCGIVEYSTSVYLEYANNGQKWWDYSGYFLNINGRICAEGLFVFGMGGLIIVYFAAPLLDNLIRKIRTKLLIPLCAALLIIFLCDTVYSSKYPNTGEGITKANTEIISIESWRHKC